MKKITILFLIMLCAFSFVKADIITQEIAAKVAKNHLTIYAPSLDYNSISLELAYTKTVDETAVYYIFNAEGNNGFIIVSAEDEVYPIIAYAIEGHYTDQPGFDATNFNYWMDNYTDQIVYARNHSLKADDYISSTWSNLLKANPVPKEIEEVDPLLSTLWNQGTYYNQLCPSDNSGPGGHVYAGCVATAMGMVMKYHNHPEQGTGSHSYNASGYGNQSADFGATTYNWSSMPNQLNSNNTSVATLLYHLGVSVNMQYSPSGSGAFSSDARDALVDYFSYSENAQLLPKNSFPIETFTYKIKNELNLNRPVYYSGSGNGGGHAFVCDGYQGESHFHFNWGWSGYGNGYFYLNNLNPGGSSFNQGQSALFYTYPEGTTVLAGAESFIAEVDNEDVHLSWDTPAGKALTGYNIYKNNSILDYITGTEYIDLSPEQGSYTYYVCAVYDEGESFPTEAISIFIGGGTTTVYEDNFEAYTSGEQLACQNSDNWTTWSNNPCSSEDAYISTDVAFEGSNSTIIENANDIVKLIDNYTEGLYKISFQIYIPDGYLGYFNSLQLFNGTNSEWGMQVLFDENGQGSVDGGGEGAGSFNYNYDTWMYQEVIIDLNNDWAEYKLDGNSIHGWQWSIGSFGTGSLNQLGGVNFFAWTGKSKGTPKFYFDDFKVEEYGELQLPPPMNFNVNVAFENIQLAWETPGSVLSYNVYYALNGGTFNLLSNTTETSYVVESPGNGLHSYYLTAIYDEGESGPTNTQEVLLTSTDDIDSEKVSLFPNPAENYVFINCNEAISMIELYNSNGQFLNQTKTNEKSFNLDISELEAGIYFIRIETKNNTFSKQIIKK